jgi:hypothetical protein
MERCGLVLEAQLLGVVDAQGQISGLELGVVALRRYAEQAQRLAVELSLPKRPLGFRG